MDFTVKIFYVLHENSLNDKKTSQTFYDENIINHAIQPKKKNSFSIS